ncbi:MAG: hypothetical protein EOP47_28885 [Sphingobacteriaceae bacterium]|nr:MAG: hypothetical protein EOP47_28885 [Sphingobacteriaceae bacterium]
MIDGIENLKRAVADPPERMIADETEQPSYVAWLDRNDQYHEIGLVMFKAEIHLLHCQLGPLKGEIIEYRNQKQLALRLDVIGCSIIVHVAASLINRF